MSTLSAALATVYAASAQRNADAHRILSSSTFFAPLTHSLALTRGSGSATFTRATTATVFDNEGKLITVPSGASRHVGARYVRNLFSSTATLTSGSSATVSSLAAGTYTFSMGAGTGTATFSGTGGATGTLTASASGRVEVTKTITAGTFVVTASVATLVDIQLENVTGQSDQTASEYVSVGVLSAPYHGLAVDGIKAFPTHKSGAPIAASSLEGYLSEPAATNNLLYCRDVLAGAKAGAWIPSTTGAAVFSDDFSTYADTAAMLAAGWTEGNGGVATLVSDKLRITQGTANGFTGKAFSTTVGETYVAVVAVTKNAASFAGIVIGSTLTNGSIYVNQTINASGVVTVTFVATHTTTYLTCQVMGSVAGAYHEFDNITVTEAALVPTLTATGIDGAANAASTLTAASADATILQPRTLASAARSSSAYIKRRIGTGNVYFTRDGGTTWTDITASLSTSSWYRAKIENSSVTNPSVGFKLATSGDAIDVDYVQDEVGPVVTSPIATTTATVTRNIDSLTYQYSGNALDSIGSAFAELYRPREPTISSSAVAVALKDANGRLMYIGGTSQATQLAIYDGTNIVIKSGLPSINSMIRKCVSSWGPSGLKVTSSGMSAMSGSFDGVMGTSGSTIIIGGGSIFFPFNGTIKNTHIWQTVLTDTQMKVITQ